MIYVYDIILNWTDNNKVYEFFEWELNDEFEHIKKIPLFKVDFNVYNELLNYEIKVDANFLDKIDNLTEVYDVARTTKIKYAALFTDGTRALALEFDEHGNLIYRSSMLLDEENEAVMLSNKLNCYDINFEKGEKRYYDLFTTRLENEMKKILTVEIKDIYKKNNFDKLKYLYFELFGNEIDDGEEAYKKLLYSIEQGINSNHTKLYEVVKLSYQNKG